MPSTSTPHLHITRWSPGLDLLSRRPYLQSLFDFRSDKLGIGSFKLSLSPFEMSPRTYDRGGRSQERHE